MSKYFEVQAFHNWDTTPKEPTLTLVIKGSIPTSLKLAQADIDRALAELKEDLKQAEVKAQAELAELQHLDQLKQIPQLLEFKDNIYWFEQVLGNGKKLYFKVPEQLIEAFCKQHGLDIKVIKKHATNNIKP